MAKEGVDWGGLIIAGIGIGGGLLVLKAVGAFKPKDAYKAGDVLRWYNPASPPEFYVTVMEVTADSYRIAGGYYPNLDGSENWFSKEAFEQTVADSIAAGWNITIAGRVIVP